MDEKELEEKWGNPNCKIVFDERDGMPMILLEDEPTQARRNIHKFNNLMTRKEKYLKQVHNELRKRKRPQPIIPLDIFIIEFKIVEDEDEGRGNVKR